MREVRCPECNRLLFKAKVSILGDLRLEILCKCKVIVFWPDVESIQAGVVNPIKRNGRVMATNTAL